MKNILVIGATGFVGRSLAARLLAAGHAVRCLVRQPSRAKAIPPGAEVVQGDVTDAATLPPALVGIDAVYVSIHTLGPQRVGGGFMDIERNALENVVAACRAQGTRRLVFVTSLGLAADAPSAIGRERWATEERVLTSGLDATVVRPGQIIGLGGQGFDMLFAQAQKSLALVMGPSQKRLRTIGVGDLADLMVAILDEPRSYGVRLEVGSDDVLTRDEMIDIAARIVGRKNPMKWHVPLGWLAPFAPLIERLAKLPRGVVRGIIDSMAMDLVGDPALSRSILPHVPEGYESSVRRALGKSD